MDSVDASSASNSHVLAIPYPGRGHVNAMINICRCLAPQKGLLITFVVTEEWLALIASDDPLPSNIRLRSIPNVLPSETTRGNDFPGFIEAVFTKMEAPVGQLLYQIQKPPVRCIVADTMLAWAVALGNQRSIPVVSLWPMSSTVFSIFHHVHLLRINGNHPFDVAENEDTSVSYFPGLSSIRLRDLPLVCRGKDSPVLRRIEEALAWVPKAQCLLLASFHELEANATDAIKTHLHLPVYTVGPFISYMTLHDRSNEPNGSCSKDDYCKWLDSKPRKSVLYVSFGSYLGVSGPQLDEIAAGLRGCGAHFLWATRDDNQHLQEVCGERGIVVPWCDQLKVLYHPSTRAFLTHCGWNSTMECAFAGVIMLTFPLGAEQHTNSKLIVEDWKVGLRVKRDVGREEVVKREEIAGIVRRVMELEGNEGKEMKRRAEELMAACKTAIEVGGSSNTNINAFVKDFLYGYD